MIAYILKSSLSLLLLFGLYWFILRKEKLFTFNRYFLIFSILLSIIIPFISIPVDILGNNVQRNVITALNSNLSVFNTEQNTINDIAYLQITEDQTTEEVHPSIISLSKILLFLYISGVILLMSRFLRNIYLISKQIRLSENVIYSGKRLVLIEDLINPYCFYKTIFVNKHDYLNRKIGKELLAHELEHIKQSHSIDILFLELVRIVYWFNPILILYSRAIRVNHEYMADNGVLRDSLDIKSYADKLLSFISYKRNIPLTSGFNHSLTKRRLLMITKPKSKSAIYGLRITLTLCMILVFFLFFSFKQVNTQSNESRTIYKDVLDTLPIYNNSMRTDTVLRTKYIQTLNVIDKKIIFTASGYIKRDTINKIVQLVDNATVSFGEVSIKADSIVINTISKQIFAAGRLNKSGKIIGKPIFKEGNEEFEADEINYNLTTHKALIKNIKAQINLKLKDSGSIFNPSYHKQIDNINNNTSNQTEKPVVHQDSNSDEWWKSILQKRKIDIKQFNFKNTFNMGLNDTINDLWLEIGVSDSLSNRNIPFKNAIFISNGLGQTYWIMTSEYARHDLDNNKLVLKNGESVCYDLTNNNIMPSQSFSFKECRIDIKNNMMIVTSGK